MSDLKAEYEALLQRLPWRTRLRLKMGHTIRAMRSRVLHALPGYRPISLLIWKAKRGGWGGVFDPAFNISRQDRTVYDRRLRWHQWGVLREADGFRAYTPTSRTEHCFPTTEAAWSAIEAKYWGKLSTVEWKALR